MKTNRTSHLAAPLPIVAVLLTLIASSATVSVAEKIQGAKGLKPLMLNKGDLIYSEGFEKGVPDTWKAAKGKWAIDKGALKGTELEADDHAASIRTNVDLPGSFIMQFDFKFEGGKVIHCSFNGKGHICRVTLTPSGFTLKGEKVKKDPADKAATVGQIRQAFKPGQWYTMLIEIQGAEFVARVSDDKVAFGSHAKVGRAKNNFGFPMAGVSSSIDNIKIWAGRSSERWVSVKKELPVNKIQPPTPRTPKQRFATMDKNHDSQLTLKEFIGKRPKATHEAATKQFARRDKNGDERLSLAEFSPAKK